MTKKEFMNCVGDGREDILQQMLDLLNEMKVAAIENVLQGKIWAYSDEQRRKSKRQKDPAAIFRLVESYPHLKDLLPEPLRAEC
ncbi:MAG: hypothetical protein WBC98_12385 [Candidatus Zixiibacteriota bacterium]